MTTNLHNRHAGRAVAWALAAAAAVTTLTACAPLIVGGAMVSGAMVATDRRTTGAQLEDKAIQVKASSQIRDALGDRPHHVSVNSYNRLVLLTGEVQTEQDKQRAEQLVAAIDNVRAVANELAIMNPSSLASRSNDTFITGRVKATFVDARDLSAQAVSVTTERATVYLLGIVTDREANRASDLARSVPGVNKVVRVFEIISEEELARILPKKTSAPQQAEPQT